jgi:hypothetical protein
LPSSRPLVNVYPGRNRRVGSTYHLDDEAKIRFRHGDITTRVSTLG